MLKEFEGRGKTLEEARNTALIGLNAPASADVHVEVVQMPKKKVLGLFGGSDAVVKVSYDDGKREKKPQPRREAPAQPKKQAQRSDKPQKAEKQSAPRAAKADKPRAPKADKPARAPKADKPREKATVQLSDADLNSACLYLKRLIEGLEPLISQHQLKVNSGVRTDKKVNVSLSVEPENLMVLADRMHFSNIVSNLIDNAIKYSEDSVKIEIKAFQKAEDEVLVSVSDNGIGIDHDKLPYIFDKFYRVTDGNKYTVKGYGLGLFYVKSLMEKMGGSVSVESEPGKGSCFTLHFLKGKRVKK